MGSRGLTQPIGQVRLTNVAIVRLKRNGKRFEIACYKNKVMNWKNKIETDLDEVLQSENVFENVTRGILATKEDMEQAFGTSDINIVIERILDKGTVQISEGERQLQFQNMFKEISSLVSSMTVNPHSNRPYTPKMIEKSMKDILHYSILPSKNAKQQALDVIRKLKKAYQDGSGFEIERSKMLIQIIPEIRIQNINNNNNNKKNINYNILEMLWNEIQNQVHIINKSHYLELIEDDDDDNDNINNNNKINDNHENDKLKLLIDPSLFRVIKNIIKNKGNNVFTIETLELNVQQEGSTDVESELARKEKNMKINEEKSNNNLYNNDSIINNDDNDNEINDKQLKKKKKKKKKRNNNNENEIIKDSHIKNKKKKNKKKNKNKNNEDKKEEEEEININNDNQNNQNNMENILNINDIVLNDNSNSNSSNDNTNINSNNNLDKKFKCIKCNVSFDLSTEQREHFRSDLHRFNLKRRLKNLLPVTLENYDPEDAQILFDDNIN